MVFGEITIDRVGVIIARKYDLSHYHLLLLSCTYYYLVSRYSRYVDNIYSVVCEANN